MNQLMREPNGGRLPLPGGAGSDAEEIGIVFDGRVRAGAGAADCPLSTRFVSPLERLANGDGRTIVVGPRFVRPR